MASLAPNCATFCNGVDWLRRRNIQRQKRLHANKMAMMAPQEGIDKDGQGVPC